MFVELDIIDGQMQEKILTYSVILMSLGIAVLDILIFYSSIILLLRTSINFSFGETLKLDVLSNFNISGHN